MAIQQLGTILLDTEDNLIGVNLDEETEFTPEAVATICLATLSTYKEAHDGPIGRALAQLREGLIENFTEDGWA